MNFLVTLAAFLIAVGVLVVFHELGHYLAARLCGVKVLRFSIGFGHPLWCRAMGADRTEWLLSAIPLGGYVKMLDEREGDVPVAEQHRAFNRQTVWKRLLIVVAGPLANLLLAVLLYWGIFIHGVEEMRPVLGPPLSGESVAARAGIANGDEVRRVGKTSVRTWGEFHWELLQLAVEGGEVELEVINPRREIAFKRLDLNAANIKALEGDPLRNLGLSLFRPAMPAIIGQVAKDSVAEQAGLRPGDSILVVDGQTIQDWTDFVGRIRQAADKAVTIDYTREGRVARITLVPRLVEDKGQRVGRIGVSMAEPPASLREQMFTVVDYGLGAALKKSLEQTWQTAWFSLKMMGRMLTGEASLSNLSGPVSIADYAGQSAKQGGAAYVRFLALISISLGILNLLPIPLLDGGHLMYYMAEVIKGGPVSERAMEIGQRIGLALLGMLIAFALFNDFSRLLSR